MKRFAILGRLITGLATELTIGLSGEVAAVRGDAKGFGKWGVDIQGRTMGEEGPSSTQVGVSSNHDVREKSNGDGSKTASERLDSDLVLGEITPKL